MPQLFFLVLKGLGNTLLANTVEEFLALLALGDDELGFAISKPDYDIGRTIDEKLFQFRHWLMKEFQIQVPPDSNAIVRAAKSAHRDLDQWITEWLEKRYGTNDKA
jgi:hypothetical protein